MRIENTKTGVTYYTRTTKTHNKNEFASIVVRQETENGLIMREILASREIYNTRAKAHISACKMCKTLANNHAWLN